MYTMYVYCVCRFMSGLTDDILVLVGPLEPVILYNQGGIHVSLHFASNCPPANPGVAVVVMSAVNTSALPVKDFSFQVAVPKVNSRCSF